jgi:DNA-binding NarL/FixJ family response regulator
MLSTNPKSYASSKKGLRVYVAEEQEFYRHLYRSSLESAETLGLMGISPEINFKELQFLLDNDSPDIFLIGFKRFTPSIFNELEQLTVHHPKSSFVILMTSIGNEEALLLRKLVQKCRKGIAVYMKQSLDSIRQLYDMLHAVNSGQVVLDPTVTNYMLMEKTEYPFMKNVTDREMEILNLLAQGLTNHGIAKTLCIDIKTVAHHLNNIYGKLKDEDEDAAKHPRVSVARLYLETTGELMPFSSKNSVHVFPS